MSPQRRKPAGFRRWTAALALAATVSAQEPASPAFEAPSGHFYSQEATAYALALGGTVLPVLAGVYLVNRDAGPLGGTLLVSGLLLGPSLGQFYAGEPGVYTGILGAAGRAVGGLFLWVGYQEAFGNQLCRGLGGMGPGETKCDDNDGNAKTTVGIAVYSAATLYSLVDTHFALRRKWRLSDRAGLTPILHFARTGEPAAGAAAWLRF